MLARALQPFSAPLRADRLADDERTAGDAQALLLEHWHELPPEARRVALAIDGADWQFHLRRAIQSPADPAKAGAIEAVLACLADIEARGTPVDRRIALALLASSDRRAADLAERVIRPRILAGVRTPDDERPPALRSAPATEPSPTADAVSAACAALDHAGTTPRDALALASLLLLDRPARDADARELEPLRRILADASHPAFPVLRRALKRDRSPASRRLAWRLLAPGPLAIAATERLRSAESPAEHDAVLRETHLLLNPRRRAALVDSARTLPFATLCPPASVPLSLASERGLARLVSVADPATQERAHDRLLATRDERARLIAAASATGARLTDFCLDTNPAVATTASLRLSVLGVARPTDRPADHRVRTTRMLARSPVARVRTIAREDLGLADLLTEDGTPTLRARALGQADPDRLAELLAQQLDTSERDPSRSVRTLRAVARLGLAGAFTERLAAMVTEQTDPRLAATAAAVLGSVPRRTAIDPLDAALAHTDARVRANAVESLERVSRTIDTDPRDRFSEIKACPDHRSRANAMRALERLRLADDGEIHDDAARMLFDARAPHRLAAVWLAERLLCDPRSDRRPDDPAWQSVARGVAALARTEDDAHIRARATRCARRLLAETKRPAPDPAIAHAARRLRAHLAEGVGAAEGVDA